MKWNISERSLRVEDICMKGIQRLAVLLLAVFCLHSVCAAAEATGIISGNTKENAVLIKANVEYSSTSNGTEYPSGWFKVIAPETGTYRLRVTHTEETGSKAFNQVIIYDAHGDIVCKETFKEKKTHRIHA